MLRALKLNKQKAKARNIALVCLNGLMEWPFHHIQQQIFEKLVFTDTASYSELNASKLENNAFSYHLNHLIKDGLVLKINGRNPKYRLTEKGRQVANRLSFVEYALRLQPQIISKIVVKDQEGNELLWERYNQPFIGKIDHLQGKLHLEEDIQTAALREVEEKTGLKAFTYDYKGSAYFRFYENNQILLHELAHVGLVKVKGKKPKTIDHKLGKAFWTSSVSKAKYEMILPTCTVVEKIIKSPRLEIETHDFHLEQ